MLPWFLNVLNNILMWTDVLQEEWCMEKMFAQRHCSVTFNQWWKCGPASAFMLIILYIDRLVSAKCKSKIAQKAPKCHGSFQGLEWKKLPCVGCIPAVLMPNKRFQQLMSFIGWTVRFRDATYKVDNTTYCKMVFNLLLFFFFFKLFFPSEITGFRNGIVLPLLLLSCMWADMSLCRHLLASMEGQDAQYKPNDGSPTLLTLQ